MKILLNDHWKLKHCDYNNACDPEMVCPDLDDSWMEVEVPGDVHSALVKNGIIEDPFYSTNAEKCRWIEDKVWWYKKDFEYNYILGENEIAELKFNGLDTFATVYLNGEKLGTHENMFTPAIFNVKDKLKQGKNTLAVKFDSTMARTSKMDYSRMWYSYSPNRVWARKAQFGFRWDWGPRIITVGIWKDVELNIYHSAKLDSVFARTIDVSKDAAEILVEVKAAKFIKDANLTAKVSLEGENINITKTVCLEGDSVLVRLRVENPQLWWTHDLGEPYLYSLSVKLINNGCVVDTYTSNIGIRIIEVKQKDERGNNRFTFVLNGVEIFSKGANWIPAHSFVGSIKNETYIKWIEIAKNCNMNMLRVWGGGIYEKDIFYEECDRQGILVWQDFMFACSSYPDFDPDFMENVRLEIEYIVKHLRNHPCLSIWCGNNEIQWIHGQKMQDLEDLRLYGEKIYHDLMPELLNKLDPSRLYWPGSPFGGNDPNSDDAGDKHNWQVWAGQVYPHKHGERVKVDNTPYGISFKRYAEDMGKFISEFGMHASPVLETLKSCIPEEELYYGSFEMRYRNKDKRPTRGKLLMESYTGLPSTLEEYIDFSMLAQAEGLKYGIEHYRRRKPECSGTLIWQLNDCWPAMSWSIVDFYMRPKAGYYYTRRVYKPVLISFKEEGADKVSLWITNDTLHEYVDTIEVGLKDFFGNSEYAEQFDVSVPANSSVKVREFSKNRMNVTYTNFEFLYAVPKCKDIDPSILFFEDYKDLNLPKCCLNVAVEKITGNDIKITIKTDFFAKFIKIKVSKDNVWLSDNYFDLMPGEQKIVYVKNLKEFAFDETSISVSALNQHKIN